MGAATKKGRPKNEEYETALRIASQHESYHNAGSRTIQNEVNAQELICVLMEHNENEILLDFFTTKEGNIKHNGIAEQIGRMLRGGYATEKQAIDIARECVEIYHGGKTSKQIEQILRSYRAGQKEGERMTEQEKIDLIIKSTELLPQDLTDEERAFLNGQWDNLPEPDRTAYYKAWERMPGTIQHAIKQLSIEDIEAAVTVLEAIRRTETEQDPEAVPEFDDTTASDLLAELKRQQAERGTECRS